MKTGEAPGPENTLAEAVKLAASTDPITLLRVMNGVLESRVFPLRWKIAQLVLSPKEKKPATGDKEAYRSICLLDNLSELQKRMIASRLERAIKASGIFLPS